MSTSLSAPASAKGHGAYDTLLREVSRLLDAARRQTARSVNAVMTATYWEVFPPATGSSCPTRLGFIQANGELEQLIREVGSMLYRMLHPIRSTLNAR